MLEVHHLYALPFPAYASTFQNQSQWILECFQWLDHDQELFVELVAAVEQEQRKSPVGQVGVLHNPEQLTWEIVMEAVDGVIDVVIGVVVVLVAEPAATVVLLEHFLPVYSRYLRHLLQHHRVVAAGKFPALCNVD